jgi:hypothetical protein
MNSRSIDAAALFLLIILINLVALQPVLQYGPGGDNAWCNSLALGRVQFDNISLWELLRQDFVSWMHTGRFYPLNGIRFVYYYLIPDIMLSMKVFLASVMLCILFTGFFVRKLLGSYFAGALAALLFPLYLQIRPTFHDPMVWGSLESPALVSLCILSIFFFWKFLSTNRKTFLWISLIPYCLCILWYEATYLLCIIHIGLACSFFGLRRWNSLYWYAALFPLVLGVTTAVTLLFRFMYPLTYPGTVLRLDPMTWLLCLVRQIYAHLPLTYCAHWWSHNPADLLKQTLNCRGFDTLFVGGLWAAIFLLAYDRLKDEPKDAPAAGFGRLCIVGLGMLILPAVVLSLSARWQDEIFWGVGYYIVMFFSYVGGIILATAGLTKGLRALNNCRLSVLRPIILAAIALFGGIICSVNYAANRASAAILSPLLEERRLLEEALRNGIMNRIPDDVAIISTLQYNQYFFMLHGKKKTRVYSDVVRDAERTVGMMPLSDLLSQASHDPQNGYYTFPPERAPYMLRNVALKGGPSCVLLGRVIEMKMRGAELAEARCDRIFAYVPQLRDCSRHYVTDVLFMSSVSADRSGHGRLVTLDPSKVTKLGRHRSYEILLIGGDENQLLDLGRTSPFFGTFDPVLKRGLVPGQPVLFKEGGSGLPLIVSGFSGPEVTHVWTDGPEAVLSFAKFPSKADLTLSVKAESFASDSFGRDQLCEVFLDGTKIATWNLTKHQRNEPYVATIPASLLRSEGFGELKFRFNELTSPKQMGRSSDPRMLGLAFRQLVIYAVPREPDNGQ